MGQENIKTKPKNHEDGKGQEGKANRRKDRPRQENERELIRDAKTEQDKKIKKLQKLKLKKGQKQSSGKRKTKTEGKETRQT